MAGYILSCCSTADLSAAHFRQRDIHYVCFHYMLDGTAYPDDLGQSMPFDDFYAAMAAGAIAMESGETINPSMSVEGIRSRI